MFHVSETDAFLSVCAQEQARAIAEVREMRAVTFQPELEHGLHSKYADVQPRINLKQPDKYLDAILDAKQRAEAKKERIRQERQVGLRRCLRPVVPLIVTGMSLSGPDCVSNSHSVSLLANRMMHTCCDISC